MSIYDLFTAPSKPTPLWGSSVPQVVHDSIARAQTVALTERARKWSQLRDFLDGVHRSHTAAAAAISHPKRSVEWGAGGGAGYRYFRLVEMLAERLSVAFHRPPELYLHAGDGEPLTDSDPKYGAQVQQWTRDQEDAELDVVLNNLDATVSILGAALVQPAWISDTPGVGKIRWLVSDPQEVYVLQNPVDPTDLTLARSVSIAVSSVEDSLPLVPSRWSTWTREVRPDGIHWGHYVHDASGRLSGPQLFAGGSNRYGAHPMVLWQARRPSGGAVFSPPDEALIQAQIGINIGLTDLMYGLRYMAHPQWVQRGHLVNAADEPVFGPDRLVQLEESGSLDPKTPQLNVDKVIAALEWGLRIEGISRSLPADILTPTAARNLGALHEQRHDLLIRRERVLPLYRRALRRTWQAHRTVANYWAARGTGRVAYGPEVQLGIRLAPIPAVQDPWQSAQARQLERQQGLGNPVQDIMDREGVSREEAARRVAENLAATAAAAAVAPGGAAPTPAKPPGPQPRSPMVERG